jgi:type 1 glutamine amidotransferase
MDSSRLHPPARWRRRVALGAAALVFLTFVLAAAPGARIVVLIGEDEYRTWETLPAFADAELKPRGYAVTVVHQDPGDKHRFPGLETALRDADLLVVSVRRRAPPRAQLDAIRAHLGAGRPLIGLRTASHAFAVRGADKEALAGQSERGEWAGFDPEVLGGNYRGHHAAGPVTRIRPAPGAAGHPVLDGVAADDFTSAASLYRVSPLATNAVPLLLGEIPGQPVEPVAWTHTWGPRAARVLYTSLGAVEDFQEPRFRRLLVNAAAWALARSPVPPAP